MPPLAPMLEGVPNCVRCLCLALFVALQANPKAARGQDVLEVPADCGSRAELERGVAELSGASAARATRPPVAMRREGDAYVLRVQLEDGERTLRDGDCRALFRAAVLISALGRDALAGLENAQDASAEPAPEKATEAAPTTEVGPPNMQQAVTSAVSLEDAAAPPISAAAQLTAPRSRALHLGASVGGALAYGVVPDFTLALGAGVYLERGWFGARFVAGYQLPQSHHDGTQGVRSDALSLAATLELLATSWLKVGLGGDFFVMHARGLGVPAARADWATLATLHAALGARVYGGGRWAFEAQARGLFAPQPARFEVRGGDAVYTTPRLGFQLGLAWGFRFL